MESGGASTPPFKRFQSQELEWDPHRCHSPACARLVRWTIERTGAWLVGFRRLRIRYDRDSERFFAFAMLACARLGYNRLPGTAEAQARSP